MRFMFVIFLVVLAILGSVSAAVAEKFDFKSIKMPHLNATYLELAKAEVDFLDTIRGKRVIWVVGEFKVGKTFLIDILTNAERPLSDPIANTLGLNIYSNNNLVIIDSEGMNQPAGSNNPYFVKEFIMNLMELTADEVVLVSDQMKLTDIEVYRRIARMYYNTKMTNFFYVHNCKTLVVSQLGEYRRRVKDLLSLDSEFVDGAVSVKPIGHLFYPAIPLAADDGDNLATAVLKYAGRAINSLGGYMAEVLGSESEDISDLSILKTSNKNAKRKTFNAKAYAEAIDQSLRYMGIELDANFGDDGIFPLKDNRKYIVDYSPPWLVYCMADDSNMVLKLRSGEFLSFARIENGKALSLNYMSYTPDYQRFKREHRVVLPVTSLANGQSNQPWKVFRHPDGITMFSIPVPQGQGEDAGIPVCNQTEYGVEITSNSAFEIPVLDYADVLLRLIEIWLAATKKG